MRYRPALLAFCCGLGLTLLLFAGVSQLEEDKIRQAFRQRANLRMLALKEGFSNAISALEATNQLFVSQPVVSRQQFRLFTEPLLRQHPYIQSFSYRQHLTDAERPAFEAALQAQVPGATMRQLSGDTLLPVPRRPSYRVIMYIEPLQRNRPMLGLDNAVPPGGQAQYQRAIDSGQATAGPLFPLFAGLGSGSCVMFTLPVYRFGTSPADPAARRAALIGETTLVVHPDQLTRDIFDAAGLKVRAGSKVELTTAASGTTPPLFFREDGGPATTLTLPRWLYPFTPPHFAQSLDVAGQHWNMVATRHAGPLADDHLASLFALGLGLVLSGLGAAYAQTLTSRSGLVQRRVEQRTAQLKQASHALLLRERAIESSTNAIIILRSTAEGALIAYVNPAFEHMTGYSAADVLERDGSVLYGPDPEQQGISDLRRALRLRQDGRAVVRNYRKDGSMFWNDIQLAPVRDDSGEAAHFVAILHDITAVKNYEAELRHQTTHDTLTGLPNRQLLQDRLVRAAVHAARSGQQVWVLSIDLDRFKFLNSRLGHKGGDLLLQAVAARLAAGVADDETVARVGGDEFAALLLPRHGQNGPQAADAQRMLASLAAPIVIGDDELFLTCSIGIAVFPGDGHEAETLIERADIAMYRAKEIGRNNYQFYTAAMNDQLDERLLIEGALRNALERAQFALHYQPQVDMSTGRLVGMEALLRWLHPELGMVAPNRFIGVAEENGLIIPIGAWVLRTACLQLVAWQQQPGRAHLRMAVNISARQVTAKGFVASVAAVLAETGLAPACLELELTESLVMHDVEQAVRIMHELKKLGVKLAIDDFGTGYSSLAHLKRFEIDVLKIDQSFVRDLTDDPNDAAIVSAIIALAASLNLEVISEGVETAEQIAFLRQHGCHRMQGYYFSRPVPAPQFATLLESPLLGQFGSAA